MLAASEMEQLNAVLSKVPNLNNWPKSYSVTISISNGDKRMQALKVPLYPYHDVINYTNNLITFFDILRSISGSG